MTTEKVESIMVFSASLAKNVEEHRLPPNYVGVRRVRASNQKVRDALRSNDVVLPTIKTPVVFKVTEKDGTERRMTAQEKKKLKLQLRKERYEARKQLKREAATSDSNDTAGNASIQNKRRKSQNDVTNKESSALQDPSNLVERQKRNYHQLEVSSAALEEEISELRGERKGVPPVMLNPPMAQQGYGILPHFLDCSSFTDPVDFNASILDDSFAGEWAVALKESMKPAEDVRAKEKMRPMAYQLVPEVWTRLRPVFESNGSVQNIAAEDKNNESSPAEEEKSSSKCTPPTFKPWSAVTIRQRVEPFDSDTSIVYGFLHQLSNLHVSCGSKFGCEFLVYDGRREERHAFAGLRVYSQNDQNSQFPIPSSYDLAGYVRTLNTAGKLALLATVKRDPHDKDSVRIAIVDLALEKVLSAPTHQKRRSRSNKKARREVGENLSKTNALSS